ncbi:MAG: Nicotinamide-nucleotide amidohydrolase PncC [Methanobacteriota archaeon]|nr:MAG: Nicotinamide-nucleotide amidohydrolase PncC [Euryarchaeota archaeon]
MISDEYWVIIMGDDLVTLASRLERRLLKGKATVSAAESCTGGLLTSTLTDISGSSACFNQSWITYSNEAKIIELNVEPKTLEEHGAVSAEVAIQMAKGARKKSNADIAISITGIAGPKSDDSRKKVGEVFVGISSTMYEGVDSKLFSGDRKQNKLNFVALALRNAIKIWDEFHINKKDDIAIDEDKENEDEIIEEKDFKENEPSNRIYQEHLEDAKKENWEDDIVENWGEETQSDSDVEFIENEDIDENAGIEDINWEEQE